MDQPAPQVRVLVVDDSVVMRRVVARALERDPGIARTDFASNGRLALAKIAERRPDVVVLDLEMPELDGFGTLAELRRTDPKLPVVLFSSIEERVAAATLDALSLGATDFIVKPQGGGLEHAEAYVAEMLTPLVKALAAPRQATAGPRHTEPAPSPSRSPIKVLAVGVSTGGPDALAFLVGALPSSFPIPLLIVQHMPPVFTRLLADRLDRIGELRVSEARDGDVVAAGSAYVAPGDRHLELTLAGGVVQVALRDGPPENSCRPAVDALFRSAVAAYGAGVLAVVLTGMGQDGMRGCQAVRAAGGQVVVEDPHTAVIGSMPGAVVDAGLAQAVLPLDLLVPELMRRVLWAPPR